MREVYEKEPNEVPKRLDGSMIKLDAEKLVPHHPLFKKVSLVTVKELLVYCVLLRVKSGVSIYKEGDSSNATTYIILFGKFLLHTAKLGPIGTASTGDTLGEEGLLDPKSRPLTTQLDYQEETTLNPVVRREELATAAEESFILEFTQGSMEKVKERLFKLRLQMDWFTIVNHMKHQWVQKKSWRQYRGQELSVRGMLVKM